jgi:hypothetical protein
MGAGHFATDNLLRVLMSASSDGPYQFGKFRAAQRYFEKYRKSVRLGYEIHEVTDPVSFNNEVNSEIRYLYPALMKMVEGAKDLIMCNALVLKINVALLEYGSLRRDSQAPFPQIKQSLHDALRDFLNYAFTVHLNVKLPDSIDKGTTEDMKGCCSSAWDSLRILWND